jgi:hypothetical protein
MQHLTTWQRMSDLAVDVSDADKHVQDSTLSTFRISKLRHAGFQIWRDPAQLNPEVDMSPASHIAYTALTPVTSSAMF